MRITNDAKRATRRRILEAARRLFARGRLRWGGHARPRPGGRHRRRHVVQLLPHQGGRRHVPGRRGPRRGPRRLRPEAPRRRVAGGRPLRLHRRRPALSEAAARLSPACTRRGAQPVGRIRSRPGGRVAPHRPSRNGRRHPRSARPDGAGLRDHALVLDVVHRRAGLLARGRLAAPGGHPGRPRPGAEDVRPLAAHESSTPSPPKETLHEPQPRGTARRSAGG